MLLITRSYKNFDIELALKTKSHKHYSKQEGFKILSISLSIFLSFLVLPDGFHHFSDSLAHLDVTRLSKKASYWLDHTAMQCSPQRWRKLNKFVGWKGVLYGHFLSRKPRCDCLRKQVMGLTTQQCSAVHRDGGGLTNLYIPISILWSTYICKNWRGVRTLS